MNMFSSMRGYLQAQCYHSSYYTLRDLSDYTTVSAFELKQVKSRV